MSQLGDLTKKQIRVRNAVREWAGTENVVTDAVAPAKAGHTVVATTDGAVRFLDLDDRYQVVTPKG